MGEDFADKDSSAAAIQYGRGARRSSPAPPEGLPPLGRLPPQSRLTLTRLPPPCPRARCCGAPGGKFLLVLPQGEAHLSPSHFTLSDSRRLTAGLSTPFGSPSLPSRTGVWPRPGPGWGHRLQAESAPRPTSAPSPNKAAIPKPTILNVRVPATPRGGCANGAVLWKATDTVYYHSKFM